MIKESELIKMIPIGRENAIHLNRLASILKMNPNTVKAEIRKARENNNMILSDTCGYWISNDYEEQKRFVSRSEQNAYTRLKTIKAMKKSLETIKGQKTISKEVL